MNSILVRLRPSPAMVVACTALLFALTGAGFAAPALLGPNTVGTKQLKKNAVISSKIKNRSLLAADFKAGQLPRGRKGDPGAPGHLAHPARRASGPTWSIRGCATPAAAFERRRLDRPVQTAERTLVDGSAGFRSSVRRRRQLTISAGSAASVSGYSLCNRTSAAPQPPVRLRPRRATSRRRPRTCDPATHGCTTAVSRREALGRSTASQRPLPRSEA